MAQTITLSQDANNYVEGMSIGKYLLINILQESFLQPGVTYTQHLMADQGKIVVPKISGTAGTVTNLCEDGTPGTTTTDNVTLDINKKATEVFDGCFTTAGIADKDWERGLNTFKMYSLREQYESHIIGYMTANNGTTYTNVTATTIDPTTYAGNPAGYLNALKFEYQRNTRNRATVALVSTAFYQSVVDAGINLGTPLGDEVYVRGDEAIGRIAGLLLVPTLLLDDVGVDVLVYNAMGLHIGRPTTVKAIGENILGAIDQISNSMGFENGLLSMWETDAQKGIIQTYVHKIFGVLIPEKAWILAGPVPPIA